jgi:hypothetical protein
VLALIDYGLSRRAIARIAGCSEGLVRYIEKIGRWPRAMKNMLARGYPTRPVVETWRHNNAGKRRPSRAPGFHGGGEEENSYPQAQLSLPAKGMYFSVIFLCGFPRQDQEGKTTGALFSR